MSSRREFIAGAVAATAAAAPAPTASNTISLRTHEWFGDKLERFPLPPGWNIKFYNMQGVKNPVLTPAEIKKAIQSPIGTQPLREIAAGKTTVAIAVDDLTRPTPTYEIVPHVIAELNAAGIKDENILFVAAHGAHYQMNGMEMAKKIGEQAVERHPWVNHNMWENLVDLGKTKGGNQVQVNTYFYNADVKITLSGLKRHGTPGYAGGPKLILPGISGMKTIRFMHYEVKQARRASRDASGREIYHVYENEQRQDMIEAARLTGVDFSVQVCYNHERRPVKVFAGDVVRAHYAACRFGIPNLSTEFAKNADIIIANAYPKGSQLHEHFGWANAGIKAGGSVVVINQNPMGEFVWHYDDQANFVQRGGGNYFKARAARKPRYKNVGQLMLYSQYVQARELGDPALPPEIIGVRSWDQVLARLKKAHTGSNVEVAVYPAAGIQHALATHDIPPDA
jgi:nickel-dependent lactate racemase